MSLYAVYNDIRAFVISYLGIFYLPSSLRFKSVHCFKMIGYDPALLSLPSFLLSLLETVKTRLVLSGAEEHLLSLHEQLFTGSRTLQASETEWVSAVNIYNICADGVCLKERHPGHNMQVDKSGYLSVLTSALCPGGL